MMNSSNVATACNHHFMHPYSYASRLPLCHQALIVSNNTLKEQTKLLLNNQWAITSYILKRRTTRKWSYASAGIQYDECRVKKWGTKIQHCQSAIIIIRQLLRSPKLEELAKNQLQVMRELLDPTTTRAERTTLIALLKVHSCVLPYLLVTAG